MKIENWPIEKLIPYARNPRRNDPNVDRMAGMIKEFGFQIPILAKADGEIIDGHLRLKAAQKLGIKELPVVLSEGLSDAQVKAFRILANKSVAWSEWDEDLLRLEFNELDELGFDVGLTGFDMGEIEQMTGAAEVAGLTDPDEVPEVTEEPVAKRGDIWLLGNHRLMCGDSTVVTDVERLMDGNKVTFVFSDAPYGISIVNAKGQVSTGLPVGPALAKGKIGGDKAFGKVGTIDRGMKAKPIIPANNYPPVIGDDNGETAKEAYRLLYGIYPKAMHIWWGANHYSDVFPPSSCWIVWDKDNGESFFADAELAYCSDKTAVRIFKHKWNGLIKDSERGEKRCHPTQKPIALAVWCMENYGKLEDIILDPFAGSGPCMIAAELLNRSCYAMEIDPHYVDVAVRRWENFTGKKAELQAGTTI